MSNYEQSAFAREIVARLRGYIARYDLNQADLAILCDVSQSQFSKILRGVRPMTVDQFATVCAALDVDSEALIAEVEEHLADRDELSSPISYVSEGARRKTPHVYEPDQLDEWATAAAERLGLNVGAVTEDDIHVTPEGPRSGYALAAKRGRKKADQPHAE